MNKREFIEKLAQELPSSKKRAEEIYNAFVSVIEKALSEGEEVALHPLGYFKVVKRKQKLARNPKNNQPVVVPSRLQVKFKNSKRIKAKLNKKS